MTKRIGDKVLNISMCSLIEAFRIQTELANALMESGLDVDLSGLLSRFDSIKNMDVSEMGNISWILKGGLSILTHEGLRDALFTAGLRCSIGEGKEKSVINEDFFEEGNRELYFPIMATILFETLKPFLPKGLSKFLTDLTTKEPSQEQK